MSKPVTRLHVSGVATALVLMAAPAFAQQGGGNGAAMMVRRDTCYTAVTGETARLSVKVRKATSSGTNPQDATRTVLAGLDTTQRRAVLTCSRDISSARSMGTSSGELSLTNRARSQQRIPVSKEVGTGPARDTAVTAVAETPPPTPVVVPTPAPVETTAHTPVPAPMIVKHYGNWYIGFGGGTAVPTAGLRQAYNSGAHFNIPIGWESPTTPLGFRVNLGYSKLEARTSFRSTNTTTAGVGSTAGARLALQDPQIWSGMADLTLRLPFLGTWGGPMHGVYLIGGGGLNKFSDYFENLARTNPELNAGNDFGTREAVTRFAANAGGGFSIGLGGMADVFAEARYVRAYTPNHSSNYVPVMLGLALRP